MTYIIIIRVHIVFVLEYNYVIFYVNYYNGNCIIDNKYMKDYMKLYIYIYIYIYYNVITLCYCVIILKYIFYSNNMGTITRYYVFILNKYVIYTMVNLILSI